MNKIDKVLSPFRRLGAWISKFVTPENFKTVFITGTVVAAIAAVVLIYFIVTADWSDMKPQWNMFNSWLCGPLVVIGMIISLWRWARGDAHYTVYAYKDKEGNLYQSRDMIDYSFNTCMMPLLGHLVLEPLVIAAFIYYPLMFLYSIVAAVMPYLLSLVVIGVVVAYYLLMQKAKDSQTRDALVVVVPALLTIVFLSIAIPMALGRQSNDYQVEPLSETVSEETSGEEAVESDASVDLENSPLGIKFLGLGEKGIKQVTETDETMGACVVTIYNFDENGLLMSKTEYPEGKEVTYTYQYDENKQLTGISSSDGLLKTDAPVYKNGRLAELHQVHDNEGLTESWTYDAEGLISTYSCLYDESEGWTTTYTYKDGKLQKEETQDVGFATVVTYNEDGLPESSKEVSDDSSADDGALTMTYEFDSQHNWTRKTVTNKDNEVQQMLTRKYQYYE